MVRWFLSISLSLLSAQTHATDSTSTSTSINTCDVFRSEAFRDQYYELRIRNCERLKKSGSIPNSHALDYTLNYLGQNYHGLKDYSCALDGLTKDTACDICKKPTQIRQGIKNGCSFILNDLKRPWGDGTTRTTGYYIDLCQESADPLVQKFYVNVGTGTITNKNYADIADAKSTLPGAFLTDDKVMPFFPYNPDKYQTLKKNLGGVLPSIRLVGLNTSNNSSEDSKPMHVSPFKTSWGCPSVGQQTAPIMRKLVEKGPALIMNYHSAQYEQKKSCDNDGNENMNRGHEGKKGNGESGQGVQ